MKLKLRCGKENHRLELTQDNNATLKTLYELAIKHFSLEQGSFYASLNGKDELKGGDDTPLSSFDIVSGDRIFIVVKDTYKSKTCKNACSSKSNASKHVASNSTQSVSENVSSGSVSSGLTSNAPGTMPLSKELASVSATNKPFEIVSSEPMVVRDSTADKLPMRLRTLFEVAKPRDEHEVLVLVCHVLLLETGFNIQLNDERKLLRASHKGAYTLVYTHDYCEDSTMTMVCVPMSTMLVVNGKLTGTSDAVTPLQLRSTDYFGPVCQGFPSLWKQLSHLSHTFKDNFAHPILALMRQQLNLPVLYGFFALMPEIQLKILEYMNVRDLLNLSMVCKNLYSLANDSALWRRLVLNNFHVRKTNSNTSWKHTYIQNYRHKLEMERRRQMRMPDNPLHVIPPGYGLVPQYPQPLPNAFPGVRGGDYDLDPFAPAPSSLFNPRGIGNLPNAGPVPGARFDPINPFRDPTNRPGRGRGLRDNANNRLNFGSGGFF